MNFAILILVVPFVLGEEEPLIENIVGVFSENPNGVSGVVFRSATNNHTLLLTNFNLGFHNNAQFNIIGSDNISRRAKFRIPGHPTEFTLVNQTENEVNYEVLSKILVFKLKSLNVVSDRNVELARANINAVDSGSTDVSNDNDASIMHEEGKCLDEIMKIEKRLQGINDMLERLEKKVTCVVE